MIYTGCGYVYKCAPEFFYIARNHHIESKNFVNTWPLLVIRCFDKLSEIWLVLKMINLLLTARRANVYEGTAPDRHVSMDS